MKARWLLALISAVCLCGSAYLIHAQQSPVVAASPIATGRIAGILNDPSGAVIPGAKIELRRLATGSTRSMETDQQGRFVFSDVPVGHYQVTISAGGFDIAVLPDLVVTAGTETPANVALKIAPAKAFVEVNGSAITTTATTGHKVNSDDQARSRNAAELVGNAPGVSLRENGQLASIPFLHGLGDERTKLVVDGMTVSSACPNHMNPPLSYIAPSDAAQITVLAGITPVSLGGDSLAGTVAVDSRQPVFASPGERLHEEGSSSGFYRSNGQNYGGALSGWVAGPNLALGYTGSWATNDDYTDGSGHKVTSTYAQSTDHTVTLAAQGAGNLFVLQASLHHTPYEGFVSAQMDLVRNYAESLNLRYRRSFERSVLDTHMFWQNTWHSMNIGRDKSTFPMPMWMPMNTHGRDLGYSVKLDLQLSEHHTLRVGNELHRFVLDDTWPAVPGTAPMMGPNTFVSINDGRRIRLGTFAEVASKWNPKWTTLVGLRNDTVWTNAGSVQGYSDMYATDANAFNASNRAHTDPDLDATVMARYEPNASSSFEFGYARKTRAPNLYERYAWSTNLMASGMIGWFGDGNYYVGNIGLKPEIAHTISGTATWHDRARKTWEIRITPYETHIQDYVDVDTLGTVTYGMSTFAQLRFANHNAGIYGADLSGNAALWNSSTFGQGRISGVAGWLHGERLDTQTGLYQMMPVNVRVALDEELKGWTAGAGVEAVDRKSNVDPHRFEQATPGYALFSLHAGYEHGHLRISAGADNLLNREYELPLGGVNFDDFMASMWMSRIMPLTGRGRSAYASLSAQF
ncbi:MAG: TonB-dependent receptor [Terriglobales bacterium]|jgi:iron complex outermembrane receptor protein